MGRWAYVYRAVGKQGGAVDLFLNEKRDVAAAKQFFSKAIRREGAPRVITLDGYAASHRAVAELKSAGATPRPVRSEGQFKTSKVAGHSATVPEIRAALLAA